MIIVTDTGENLLKVSVAYGSTVITKDRPDANCIGPIDTGFLDGRIYTNDTAFAAGSNTGVSTVAAQVETSGTYMTPKGVLLLADAANTAVVWVGDKNVAQDNGIPLAAGESVVMPAERLSDIYAVSESGTNAIHWTL